MKMDGVVNLDRQTTDTPRRSLHSALLPVTTACRANAHTSPRQRATHNQIAQLHNGVARGGSVGARTSMGRGGARIAALRLMCLGLFVLGCGSTICRPVQRSATYTHVPHARMARRSSRGKFRNHARTILGASPNTHPSTSLNPLLRFYLNVANCGPGRLQDYKNTARPDAT